MIDTTTGGVSLTLRGHSVSVTTVAWNPDGSRLASAGADRTVKVWDARTGELCFSGDLADEVHGVAWSDDGRALSALGADGMMHVWDAGPGSR